MKMSTPRMLLFPIGLPLSIIFIGMKLIGAAGEWCEKTMMNVVWGIEKKYGWVNTTEGWVRMTDEEYMKKFGHKRR